MNGTICRLGLGLLTVLVGAAPAAERRRPFPLPAGRDNVYRPSFVEDFTAYGGSWIAKDGELEVGGGPGPTLVYQGLSFADGEVGVELFFRDRQGGNAGLILRVSEPAAGADAFIGYEIALDAQRQVLRLGRHWHNFDLLKDVPCEVPVNQWISLVVRIRGRTIAAEVDGKSVAEYEDTRRPLPAGKAGLRPWQREARHRTL